MTPDTFTCPRCGRTSHHPDDAYYRYCGACHALTDDERSSRVAEELVRLLRRERELTAELAAAKALARRIAIAYVEHVGCDADPVTIEALNPIKPT